MSVHSYLFKTEALKVSPYDKPFFYTTGKIGPIYINTHYLYGSACEASVLLDKIDDTLRKDKTGIPKLLLSETREQYEKSMIYRSVTDGLLDSIRSSVDLDSVGYISGGERRDWFFSFIAAQLLNKKHITIFKDGTQITTDNDLGSHDIPPQGHKAVIHVCDLVTEASSFIKSWIPALEKKKMKINSVYSIVDRRQGGTGYFRSNGIAFHPLISIDLDFFKEAMESGYIGREQFEQIKKYLDDPDKAMKDFLMSNSDFLKNSLSEGTKEAAKARILIENNLYDLLPGFLPDIDRKERL